MFRVMGMCIECPYHEAGVVFDVGGVASTECQTAHPCHMEQSVACSGHTNQLAEAMDLADEMLASSAGTNQRGSQCGFSVYT